MSNQYNIAPPTNGKVIVQTTLGDIEIELWSKEIPNHCRHFITRCLHGHYDNRTFNRIIPNFLVQVDSNNNSNNNNENEIQHATSKSNDDNKRVGSLIAQDEFHSRIKFLHRGIVAYAKSSSSSSSEAEENDDEKSDSGNDAFFITLNKTEQLNHRHTIIGKVVGDTIYNVLKMSELKLRNGDDDDDDDNDDNNDDDNRHVPVYAPKILKTIVAVNPFPDIDIVVPPKATAAKNHDQKKQSRDDDKMETTGSKKRKRRAIKNVNLLSFGDEVNDDEAADVVSGGGIDSVHDVLMRKRAKRENESTHHETLVKTKTTTTTTIHTVEKSNEQQERQDDEKTEMHDRTTSLSVPVRQPERKAADRIETKESLSSSSSSSSISNNEQTAKIATTTEKFDRFRSSGKAQQLDDVSMSTTTTTTTRQSKYLSKKRSQKSRDEKETLARLAKFAQKMNDDTDSGHKRETNGDWRSHKLTFDKSNAKESEKADEDYEVIDHAQN